MIVYNTTDEPIFITAGPITADPRGGRGHGKTDYLIAPGEGIELDIVGLSLKKDKDIPGRCSLCGEAMPKGEEMFKYHGYSGPCPTNKT